MNVTDRITNLMDHLVQHLVIAGIQTPADAVNLTKTLIGYGVSPGYVYNSFKRLEKDGCITKISKKPIVYENKMTAEKEAQVMEVPITVIENKIIATMKEFNEDMEFKPRSTAAFKDEEIQIESNNTVVRITIPGDIEITITGNLELSMNGVKISTKELA